MATYKLMQDIEADDKLVLNMTFRQFVYLLVAALFAYLCVLSVTQGAAFLVILFGPIVIFFGFFAFPFGRDQPTEVWALAKIRFFFKPRRRIWDQSGAKQLVSVTAPKRVERTLTNGLTRTEVESRLTALANTIDSRGWAVKNVNVNLYSQPNPLALEDSDRLINIDAMPHEVPNYDVSAADDMLDELNNPVAQQFEHMINESVHSRREQLMNRMNDVQLPAPGQSTPQTPADYWFMNQSAQPAKLADDQAVFTPAPVVAPGSHTETLPDQTVSPDEENLSKKLKAKHQKENNVATYSHLRTLKPIEEQQAEARAKAAKDAKETAEKQAAEHRAQASAPTPDPVILSLANNNDRSVASLAREAHKAKEGDSDDGEVVISLR